MVEYCSDNVLFLNSAVGMILSSGVSSAHSNHVGCMKAKCVNVQSQGTGVHI